MIPIGFENLDPVHAFVLLIVTFALYAILPAKWTGLK